MKFNYPLAFTGPCMYVDVMPLGETETCVVAEFAAVMFNPETAEIGGKLQEFNAIVNIGDALRTGTVDAAELDTFLRYRQFDIMSPHGQTMKEMIEQFVTFMRIQVNTVPDQITVFCGNPAYHLPPLMRALRDLDGGGVPWARYNVWCARTIMQMVGSVTPLSLRGDGDRPSQKKGHLIDQVKFDAIRLMRALHVWGEQCKVKPIGPPKRKAFDEDDEDDEL